MTFVAVTFVYPLILAALSGGTGLLVERLAGLRLPAKLIPAAGFGAMVVVSQLAVLSPAVAPATPVVLVIAALCGYVAGRESLRARWRVRARGYWLGSAAAAAAYITVALPLIASGRPTFPGYLLDTTAGFQLTAGDWMLHHGAPLPPPYPAFGAMLHDYWGTGYPSGGQVLLAATGWLSGQSLLWLYFPFQVFALALTALAAVFLAERAGLSRFAAAFAGWIASVSALVAAYTMMGSIKELTALPLLLMMGGCVVIAPSLVRAGFRGAVPFAVAAAGAIGAIGLSAVAWIGAFAIAALGFSLPALGSLLRRLKVGLVRRTIVGASLYGVALVALILVLAIPTVTRLASSLQTALAFSGSSSLASDPGNLLRPLRFVQVFGIWLGPSHRVNPEYTNETYAFIGVAMACFVLGVLRLARRRAWPLLAFVAASSAIWLVLYARGTEWTSAKVMMLMSPVFVLVAVIGAFGDLSAQKIQGAILAGVLGVGVLASDALLYHGTNMAPTSHFLELSSIGQRFAGQGPTLLPDFDEYTFYELRHLDVDSPGFASDMRRPFALFGLAPRYGHSYDVDDIEAPFVQQFKLIVMRRSPRWSRPPGNYELAWSGAYYDVWRRIGPAPLFHVPAGTGLQAVGVVPCAQVHSLAQDAAAAHAELRYAVRPPNLIASIATAAHSPLAVLGSDEDGLPDVSFAGPGEVNASVSVAAAGRYQLWLGGDVGRPLVVMIDGRQVGAPSAQSGGDGNMIDVAPVQLTRGRHTITLSRGGGSLVPGDSAGTVIDGIYLEAVDAEHETVAAVPARAWRSLCGRSLDWIEVA